MKNLASAAENTIIIEPKSRFIQIGRLNDLKPKRFHHCIARKVKTSSVSSRRNNSPCQIAKNFDFENDPALESLRATVNQTLNCQSSDWNVSNCVMSDFSHFKSYQPTTFDQASSLDETSNFIASDEVLNLDLRLNYRVAYPFQCGFLSRLANPSAIVQDLEDIWLFILESYLGIRRTSFASLQVILIIPDIFHRTDIRHLVDLILDRLGFGRLLIHQSAVLASFAAGLPIACVVELGYDTTSISCVEGGSSLAESRIKLGVGAYDFLRLFQLLTFPKNWLERLDHSLVNNFDLSNPSDIKSLDNLVQAGQDWLQSQSDLDNTDDNNNKSITVNFDWPRAGLASQSFPLSLETLLLSHLLPLASCRYAVPSNRRSLLTFQPSQASMLQPDDPFDFHAYGRDRRRNKQQPAQSTIDGVSVDNNNAGDKTTDKVAKKQSATNPSRTDPSINSLVDAINWSIDRFATTMAASNDNSSSSDEIKRLLQSNILLHGPMTDRLTCFGLFSWLESVFASQSSSNILSTDHPSQSAYSGARLLVAADASSSADLGWLTASDWKAYGTRLLRERSLFVW